jgi:glycosyltransferase involved in cell wall biosynthesis
MTPDGTVYPYSVFDYTFWRRYLEVFDEVVVFGRVGKIGEVDPETMPPKSSGPGVTFFPLPDFLGAWQYLKAHRKLVAMSRQILTGSDACVLRVPSYLSMLLCREFIRTKRPYAVEVVGDPWSQLAPGSFASRLRPIIRRKWTWDMKRQCRHAAVAAYVTEYILQKRFPPGGWSNYYSSIELPASAIVDQSAIDKRIRTIDGKAKACGPWRICFVGSLWHLSKSPDILIGAVADCINKGIKLELVIVGEGKHRLQLEQQAQQLGISEYVKFTGQLSPGQPVYDQLRRQ